VRVAESGGRITSRTIRIGLNNKITVEVKAGLRQGEHVVIGEKSRSGSVASAVPSPPGEF
jgi:macrolide-specific efflux system membrane fusion protein